MQRQSISAGPGLHLLIIGMVTEDALFIHAEKEYLMANAFMFRILLLSLFIGFVAHRGYYNHKFGHANEGVIKQRGGNFDTRLANLLSVPALLATFLYIVSPAWVAWAALPFPVWLRWGGVGIAGLGFVLLQWAHQALGKNWSDTPRLLQGQTLVTNGPYRWVRHPIYTAFFLIMSATLFLSANWLIGITWIGMTALDVISRIGSEEAMLMEQFGEQYRIYSQRTGQVLPRLN